MPREEKQEAEKKICCIPLSAYANAYAMTKFVQVKLKIRLVKKEKTSEDLKPKAMGGRVRVAGGGLMEATQRLRRQGLKRGGGVCLRGMNREAIGKNS